MKNHKKLIISLIVAIIAMLAIIIEANIISKNNKVNLYEEKINNLINKYNLLELETKGYSISISNKNDQAKTFYKFKDNDEENNNEIINKNIFNELNEEVKKYISKNKYDASWIKINLLKEKKLTSSLNIYIEKANYQNNSYPFGLLFESEKGTFLILSEELNANNLMDKLTIYDQDFFQENFNNYLKENKINFTFNNYIENNNIYKINEDGYFIDEENNMYHCENLYSTLNRRTDYEESKLEISEKVITDSTNYLFNLLLNDGSFDYQYDMSSDEKVDEYNIIRHAGSMWSLVRNYDKLKNKNENTIKKIQKGIDYLINNVYDSNDICIAQDDDGNFNLGASALISCALTDYYNNVSQEKDVFLISKKLCDGMIEFQDEETGSITHKINSDMQSYVEYSTDYYDGEACYALLEMYELTKQEKYLNAAIKLLKEFFNDKEDNYYNHWISYSMLYIAKNNIDVDKSIIDKFNKQINFTADKYLKRNALSHVALEFLSNSLNYYYTMKENNKGYLVSTINENVLKDSLNVMFENQLNTFIFEELAMFYKNPKRALNSFIITSQQRLRIDDIQHSILGFNDYVNLISKYNLD